MAQVTPVILFPSLAGSVLECRASTLPEFEGERIWLDVGTLLAGSPEHRYWYCPHSWCRQPGPGGGSPEEEAESAQPEDEPLPLAARLSMRHSEVHETAARPFVQHIVLPGGGKDPAGIVVRAKPGLAGWAARRGSGLTVGSCEYLSENPLLRDGTAIMGKITERLRKHGYSEWDGTQGSMIGASFDWRLMPSQMEHRDQFFTDMLEQTEAMVAGDPEHRPAVVIGFSLGCRIAKYFLHFCHAKRGEAWMSTHIQHFVALGGPFRGAVKLQGAVLVDGSFPPLDLMFSRSQMLTILRGVPVGRYLQPSGEWEDGLDTPFVLLRDETYLIVRIGPVSGLPLDGTDGRPAPQLKLDQDGAQCSCVQSLSFHAEQPFIEAISFVLSPLAERASLRVSLVQGSSELGAATVDLQLPPDGLEREHCLNLVGSSEQKRCSIQLKTKTMASCQIGGASDADQHPLAQHNGGLHASNDYCRLDCPDRHRVGPAEWSAVRPSAVMRHEGLREYPADDWLVPGPDGAWVSDLGPPPVPKVTSIYGVNQRTPRTLFLRHRRIAFQGGKHDKLEPQFLLDVDGDVDGLLVYNGIGYETSQVAQQQPDTNEQVFISGDGTVNYQSLRWPATWQGPCEVEVHELDGCDHRGASTDPRMLEVLESVLGLNSEEYATDEQEPEKLSRITRVRHAAAEPFSSAADWCTQMRICALISKLGVKSLNLRYRRVIRWVARFMAIVSLLICVFCLAYGFARDYDIISFFAWGSAGSKVFDYLGSLEHKALKGSHFFLGSGDQQVELGLLTYAYLQSYMFADSNQVTVAHLSIYEDSSSSSCSETANDIQKYEMLAAQQTLSAIYYNNGVLGIIVNCLDTPFVALYSSNAAVNAKQHSIEVEQIGDAVFYTVNPAPGECIDTGLPGLSLKLTCQAPETAPVYYPVVHWSWDSLFGAGLNLQNGGKYALDFNGDQQCQIVTCTSETSYDVKVFSNMDCSGTPFIDAIAHQTGSWTGPPSVWNYVLSCNRSHPEIVDYSNSFMSSTVLVSNQYAKCEYSYRECKEIGYEPRGDWRLVSSYCTKGLTADMCEHCYHAGVLAVTALCITTAFMLPTVWLSFVRTNAADDSRLKKFMSLPILLVTICLAVVSAVLWLTTCLGNVEKSVTLTLQDLLNTTSFAQPYAETHVWAFLPIISASLILMISAALLMTPVPELYQTRCDDPESFKAVPNSMLRMRGSSDLADEVDYTTAC